MHRKKVDSNEVDAYIAGFSSEVQDVLQSIRATVKRLAPEAEEVISYRMPAFKQNGILLYYAAWQNHIGLYPPISGDEALEKSLKRYAGPKGNLQFPLSEPLPLKLIERIVKLRLKQLEMKAASKRAKRDKS